MKLSHKYSFWGLLHLFDGLHVSWLNYLAKHLMTTAILWLRTALRAHDNPLLTAAQDYDHILPVYVLPKDLSATHYGVPRLSAHRLQFTLEALDDLKSSLQSLGSDLYVLQGDPEDVLPKLAEQTGATTLIYEESVTSEEKIAESKTLDASGLQPKAIWTNTLFHIDDLPFAPHQMPDVYTSFRKAVEKQCEVREETPTPDGLPPLPDSLTINVLPTLEDYGLITPPTDERSAFPFQGGETAALNRLQDYLWQTKHLSHYKRTRNGLIGTAYSSKFSPWLAQGSISPVRIYHTVKRYEEEVAKNKSTYWLIFELIWRDYFRYIALKYGDRLVYPGGLKLKDVDWDGRDEDFEAWAEGRTGVPFVDANMRELKTTGFMSNRGRQIVASYLAHDLGVDWRKGAAWFEHLLKDYDVHSNWGNWAYVAGVGTDPRDNRYFNILSQARKYDEQGAYVRLWCPELREISDFGIHHPWSLDRQTLKNAGVELGVTYPNPVSVNRRWEKYQAA